MICSLLSQQPYPVSLGKETPKEKEQIKLGKPRLFLRPYEEKLLQRRNTIRLTKRDPFFSDASEVILEHYNEDQQLQIIVLAEVILATPSPRSSKKIDFTVRVL